MYILNAPTGIKEGRQLLGRMIRAARAMRGWTLDDLKEQIAQNVSYRSDSGIEPYIVSKSQLSVLERGQPVLDPLLFESIAVLELLDHPIEQRALTIAEIKAINCGLFDPKTGAWLSSEPSRVLTQSVIAS
ncbi:helix-turn-helix transcriptional regulator [Cyanobacteria bacterium FACHB-DQ100]|nr:helix-turn-helix transcriptional regulator [Cyanobacteria bacterium FACHB-DQ100]